MSPKVMRDENIEDETTSAEIGNPARQEEIRRRAYEIYLERGEQPGCDLDDWLQAERELQRGELGGRAGGSGKAFGTSSDNRRARLRLFRECTPLWIRSSGRRLWSASTHFSGAAPTALTRQENVKEPY